VSTLLYRKQGDQFYDNAGNRLISGNVYYYLAGTAILQTTYSDNAGTVPNTNPIPLNGDGRLTVPVYFGSANNYKELVQDSFGNTISPWPFDNIPCAVAVVATTNYAQTLLPWIPVTSSSSPVAPAATAAGNGYECDTSGGSIVFNLPLAATVGAGKGYTFKKIATANLVTINANGSDLIDGAAALIIVNRYNVFSIISDGANWEVATGFIPNTVPSAIGLTITNDGTTPNTKIDIGVTQALLTTSVGIPYFWSGGSLVIDLTTSGVANGMDTGSIPVASFLYIYLISNGTTVAGLASLSATAPTLPTGYVYSMRIGAMLTSSSLLRKTYQTGRRVKFNSSPPSLGTGTITYATFFPSTSEAAMLTADAATVANDSWSVSDMDSIVIGTQGAIPSGSGEHVLQMLTVQNTGGASFTTSGTGATFTAYGWIDRVNAT
jgi:hypothetical protein